MRVVYAANCMARLVSVLFRMSLALIALGLMACSSKEQASLPDPRISYVSANARAAVPVPKAAVYEADGIEVQSPPVYRTHREPDDPTEPFSPNYGTLDPEVVALARNAEPWIIPGAEDIAYEVNDPRREPRLHDIVAE